MVLRAISAVWPLCSPPGHQRCVAAAIAPTGPEWLPEWPRAESVLGRAGGAGGRVDGGPGQLDTGGRDGRGGRRGRRGRGLMSGRLQIHSDTAGPFCDY